MGMCCISCGFEESQDEKFTSLRALVSEQRGETKEQLVKLSRLGVAEREELKVLISARADEQQESFASAKWHRDHLTQDVTGALARSIGELKDVMAELRETQILTNEELARQRFLLIATQKVAKEAKESSEAGRKHARDTADVVRKNRADVFAEIATSSRAVVRQLAQVEGTLTKLVTEERVTREADLKHRIEEHRGIYEAAFTETIDRLERDMVSILARHAKGQAGQIQRLLEPVPSLVPPVVQKCIDDMRAGVVDAVADKEAIVLKDRDEAADRLFQLLSSAFHHALRDMRDNLVLDIGMVIRQHAVEDTGEFGGAAKLVMHPLVRAPYIPQHGTRASTVADRVTTPAGGRKGGREGNGRGRFERRRAQQVAAKEAGAGFSDGDRSGGSSSDSEAPKRPLGGGMPSREEVQARIRLADIAAAEAAAAATEP